MNKGGCSGEVINYSPWLSGKGHSILWSCCQNDSWRHMDSNDSGHVQWWKANATWWVPYGLLPRTSFFLDLGWTRLDQIPKLGSLCQALVSLFYDARGTTREITNNICHRIIWHDHTWTRRAAKRVSWLKHLIDSMSSGLDDKIVLWECNIFGLFDKSRRTISGRMSCIRPSRWPDKLLEWLTNTTSGFEKICELA